MVIARFSVREVSPDLLPWFYPRWGQRSAGLFEMDAGQLDNTLVCLQDNGGCAEGMGRVV
jgi:hypothetical protein